jgi:hypothetical protein
MPDTNTTNFGLVKPEVGGSADTWGTKINTDLDSVDTLLDGVIGKSGAATLKHTNSNRLQTTAGGVEALGRLTVTTTTDGFLGPRLTTAERDLISTPPAGLMIYNTTLNSYQVYNGTSWASVGGGATGGGADQIFIENGQTVTVNYTVPSGRNAMSTGPISVNSGVTVTVSSGSNWVIL